MARVVCQVLTSPERLTFLWSDGITPFEPYHKTGDNLREFRALAQQAHDRLRDLATAGAKEAGLALARVGHELYRALFRADDNQAEAATAVQSWLTGLARDGAVERVEILTDAPTLLPWDVLHDTSPDEHSFHAAADTPQMWQSFWGVRYGLTVDRRVSPLRVRPALDKPAVLFAAAPALREGLPEEQRKRLYDLAQAQGVRIAESADELAGALADAPVDILYLLCRVSDSALLFGNSSLPISVLGELLRRHLPAGEGRPDTVVFLNACDGSKDAPTDVVALLQALGTRAVIGPQIPLPTEAADNFGLDFLTGFLSRGERLGKLLQDLRARTAPLGLLYTTYGPANLRVGPTGQATATAIRAEGAAPQAAAGASDEGPEPLPLPATPYRPLMPYEAEDRPLFIGREADTENVAELLDEAGVRVVLLHGRSGVGKGSLLRAGVLPYLEEDSTGFHVLDDRSEEKADGAEDDCPLLLVRATNDLAGQLAFALCAYCARPYRYTTPSGKDVVVDLPAILAGFAGGSSPAPGVPKADDTAIKSAEGGLGAPPPLPAPGAGGAPQEPALREALRRQPALAGRIVAALAERLPHELILVIEQGEELITLNRKEGAPRVARSLAILRGIAEVPSRARLLVSLRTEYLGRLAEAFEQNSDDRAGVRSYLLRELDKEALLEAVLLPTASEAIPGSTDVPWLRYLFRYEEGVAEQIVNEALAAREREQPLLPLLQVMCHQLFEVAKGRAERVIRATDVTEVINPPGWWSRARLAGTGGSITAYTGYLLRRLLQTRSRFDRRAFEGILEQLYFREPDGTAVRDLVPERDFAGQWRGSTPLQVLVDDASAADVGLLAVDWLNVGGRQERHVSLGHDVLAAAEAQRGQEKRQAAYGWERIKDTLWIMIPLLILAGVFAWTRMVAVGNLNREVTKANKVLEKLTKGEAEWKSQALGARWPLYVGQIVQAQQALRVGDALSARQYLQMQWPALQGGKDMRAFEWYYLTQQLHSERYDLLGHRGTVAAVTLSADGTVLASGSYDGSVRLWDAAKGQIRATFKGHKGPVHAVALAPDGKTLASGGKDGSVILWEATAGEKGEYVAEGKALQTLTEHKGAVLALAYAPDGKTLASAGADATIRLWDVSAKDKIQARATLKDSKDAKGEVQIRSLAYSPDGKTLAAGDDANAVKLWDVSTPGKETATALDGHGGPVQAVAYAPDGKTLATAAIEQKDGSEIGAVRLWDPATKKERIVLTPAPPVVWALAFAADGKTLATGGKDDAVRLWDTSTGEQSGVRYGHVGWVRGVAFSRDGKTLASGSYDGTVKVWDPAPARDRDVLTGHKGWVNAVAFSPDDKWLASAGADGTIKLWDVATGKEQKTLAGHKGAVLGLAFSPDGKVLASAGVDKAVRVWDADPASKADGPLAVLTGHTAEVNALSFAETSKVLASGDSAGEVRIWEIDPKGGKDAVGKEKRVLKRNDQAVRSLSFMKGTRVNDLPVQILVSAGDDRKVVAWEAERGRLVAALEGHTAEVRGVAFWPGSGLHVISAGTDRTLKVWDVSKRTEVATLRGHVNAVSAVACSGGDVPLCISGGWDGLVKLWNPTADIAAERFTLSGHKGPVQAVAISANQRTVASASRDGTVRLWRAAAEGPAFQHPRGDED